MGLGLPVSSNGDFKPIVKYDARAGRMFRMDRDASTGEKGQTEITDKLVAVFDLAQVEVGFVKFNEGGAPEWHMVRIGEKLPARPSADHKPGFRMDIKLPPSLGGDVREFSSAAGCVIAAVDALHAAYEAAPEAKAGKLPVVKLAGANAVKSGSGAKSSTNYQPVFEIVKWVDRPAEMAANDAAPAAPVAQARPVAPAPSAETEF